MDISKDVQELLDKHEAFKLKWLDLRTPDMFSWIELKEKMKFKVIELKSLAVETKAQIERDKAIRVLELKAMVDDNGKKVHTEKSIDSTITLEFKDRVDEYNSLSKYRELLLECAENVIEYVNVVKLHINNNLPF